MRLTILFTLTLLFVPAHAGDFYIDWQVAYSPPGGDIVAGDKIGRYVIEATPTVRYGYAQFSVKAQAYGLQTWMPKEQRGHGLDKFKGSYAWGAEEWRHTLTPRLEIGTERVNWFIENYSPVDRHGAWGKGHGQATEYYWLTGVSGRITF